MKLKLLSGYHLVIVGERKFSQLLIFLTVLALKSIFLHYWMLEFVVLFFG